MNITKLRGLICCLFLVGCDTEKLPPKTQQDLNRATDFIEQFRTSLSRIPSRDEYLAWRKTNELGGVIDYQIESNGKTNEYVLYIWLGERMVTYSSSDKTIHRRD